MFKILETIIQHDTFACDLNTSLKLHVLGINPGVNIRLLNPYCNLEGLNITKSNPKYRMGVVVQVSDSLNIELWDPFGSQSDQRK